MVQAGVKDFKFIYLAASESVKSFDCGDADLNDPHTRLMYFNLLDIAD